MPTPIENLTQNASSQTQRETLQSIGNQQSARRKIVDKSTAISAIVNNGDTVAGENFFSTVAGDTQAEDLLTDDNALMDKLAESGRMTKSVANNSDRFTRLALCKRTGRNASNYTGVRQIVNDGSFRSEIFNKSNLAAFLAGNATAVNEVTTTQTFIDEIAGSAAAMNKVAASPPAMDEIIATMSALNSVTASNTARSAIISNAVSKNKLKQNDTAFAKVCAGEGGSAPSNFSTMSDVAADSTVMSTVASTQTLMNTLVDSQSALTDVFSSSTALNQLNGSSSAMNTIANSRTASNELANSGTAMSNVVGSSTAMDELSSSSTARSELKNSSTAKSNIKNSDLALTKFTAGLIGDTPSSYTSYTDLTSSSTAFDDIVNDTEAFDLATSSTNAIDAMATSSNSIQKIDSDSTLATKLANNHSGKLVQSNAMLEEIPTRRTNLLPALLSNPVAIRDLLLQSSWVTSSTGLWSNQAATQMFLNKGENNDTGGDGSFASVGGGNLGSYGFDISGNNEGDTEMRFTVNLDGVSNFKFYSQPSYDEGQGLKYRFAGQGFDYATPSNRNWNEYNMSVSNMTGNNQFIVQNVAGNPHNNHGGDIADFQLS